MNHYPDDIDQAIKILTQGGIILYPTDTIWGIGCDATLEPPVKRIYQLKNREEKKSMIILVPSVAAIDNYVDHPSPKLIDYLTGQEYPTTAIFPAAKNLAGGLINEDGSIAIRVVREPFCVALLQVLRKPLVSTSANVSGHPSPSNFQEVEEPIRKGVDYVVKYRQDDTRKAQPSHIVKINEDGELFRIR